MSPIIAAFKRFLPILIGFPTGQALVADKPGIYVPLMIAGAIVIADILWGAKN